MHNQSSPPASQVAPERAVRTPPFRYFAVAVHISVTGTGGRPIGGARPDAAADGWDRLEARPEGGRGLDYRIPAPDGL
ncbi:MAG: hypothetical protein F4X40_03715 [Chloroflexi bacterium]|nr:hypothetical protein [Chloroflexota bacterium]